MQGAAALNLAYGHRQLGASEKAINAFAHALALNETAGNMLAALNALRGWGQLLLDQGQLAQAEARFRDGLGLVANRPLLIAPLQVSLGQLCLETGRFTEAEQLLVSARQRLALSGPVNQGEGLAALARLRLAQGNPAAVSAIVTELQNLQRAATSPFAREQLAQALLRTAAALHNQQPTATLNALLISLLTAESADPLIAARGWLALGQPDQAQALLATATAAPARQQAAGRWLVAALLRALAHAGLGAQAEALDWLARSLMVGGPAGYRQLYLELGPAAAPAAHHPQPAKRRR